jgi:signal transduction histidine kinase/ActR/RegA family two-component response regulator
VSTLEQRVLMLMSVAKDGDLARRMFSPHDISTHACTSVPHLCEELERGAGAILIVEEALREAEPLMAWVRAQPPWSDLPILLLARPGVDQTELAASTFAYGNVTILERPSRVTALVSAVRSALRARSRQYQSRDYLARQAATEEHLRLIDRRKDEFLAILAHELRNPLAPITNGLAILQLNQSADPRIASVGAMMGRQLGNLTRLVDDLLEVSRVTRGDVELRLEQVNLDTVIRSAIEASQPLITSRGHRFAWQLPPQGIRLHADPMRLGQVISNLLNNAAKYTNPGGNIELRVTAEDGHARIDVRDDGIGLPAQAQTNIFDLFVRVQSKHDTAQGGLGIGLTLAKRLVELHNGTIAVHSEGHGRGSCFTVRLPMLSFAAEPERPARSSPQAQLADLRIIVADDNRDAAESLGMLLEQMGASVHVTYGGKDALAALDREPADAAIIDLGMPDLDGFEVARRIRRDPGRCEMTLIALTGWGQHRDREATQRAGFDHHLIKPPDIDRLIACLADARTRPRKGTRARTG